MKKNKTYLLNTSVIVMALGVIIGAFAAHGLKPHLDLKQQDMIKTATLYHFIHGLSLVLIAFIYEQSPNVVLKRSYIFFLSGILCFSGSLYLLATRHLIGGDSWLFLGPVTPIGGVLFILGWINLFFYQNNRS